MKKEKKYIRFTIRAKAILMVIFFSIVLAGVAIMYFSIITSNDYKTNYKRLATDLSNTVALSVDRAKVKTITDQAKSYYDAYDVKPTRDKQGTPEYVAYMSQFEALKQTSEFKDIQNYLKGIKETNIDTDGIYLAFVDYSRKLAIYTVYDHASEFYPAGIIDPLYEEDYPLCDNPKLGFVASIYHDEVANVTLVTAGAPILDSNGDVICYALVDITLANIQAKEVTGILYLILYLVSTVIVVCIIGIIFVHFTLVKPVNTLQNAAKSYDVNEPEKTHQKFNELYIKGNNEFTDLAENMKKMENDINTRINELVTINQELKASQRVAKTMTELASKDALTGVKNKSLHKKAMELINEKIKKGEKVEFGFAMVDLNYLKTINDDYGHNNGDAAIVNLCNLICDTFAHSPVYRIGGDEFVVLLRNHDYQNVEMLVDRFNKAIEERWDNKDLEISERISAAIGYAKYDPARDTSAEDVFKRADRSMYDRKWTMKMEHDRR